MKHIGKAVTIILAFILIVGIVHVRATGYIYKTEKTKLAYSSQISQKQMTFFAHRGYSDVAPEESVRAEELAAKKGFQGLNIDLWPTKKDSAGHFDFAVSHSNKLSSLTDRKGLITDLTAAQVKKIVMTKGNGISKTKKDYIPLLSDMITLANKYNLPIQIEMKGRFTDEQMDVLYQRLSAFKKKVYIECIYRQRLNYMMQKIIANHTTARYETTYICYGKNNDIDYCASHHINWIALEYDDLTQKNFNYAKKKGVKVSIFAPVNTMDTKRIAYRAYKIGVRVFTSANRAWKPSFLSHVILYA